MGFFKSCFSLLKILLSDLIFETFLRRKSAVDKFCEIREEVLNYNDSLPVPSCSFCGSDQLIELITKKRMPLFHKYFECEHCGIQQIKAVPVFRDIGSELDFEGIVFDGTYRYSLFGVGVSFLFFLISAVLVIFYFVF